MPRTSAFEHSVAGLFRDPPEYVARRVTGWWHDDHPEWTPDEVLRTYEFLLEVYRQARAWWLRHRQATEPEVTEIFHEIIKAHIRGKRMIPLPPSLGRFRATSRADADPPHLRAALAMENLGELLEGNVR